MANGEETRGTWNSQFGFRIGFIVALILQTIAATTWLVQMHSDVEAIKASQQAQDKLISKLDETGSRQVAPLIARIEENSAYTMRLDMAGGRKEVELEQQLKFTDEQLRILKEMFESRSKIIEKAQEAFTIMAVTQNRLKNIEDDLAALQRVEQQEHNNRRRSP